MRNCCVTDDVGPTILIFVMRLLLVLFKKKKRESAIYKVQLYHVGEK